MSQLDRVIDSSNYKIETILSSLDRIAVSAVDLFGNESEIIQLPVSEPFPSVLTS